MSDERKPLSHIAADTFYEVIGGENRGQDDPRDINFSLMVDFVNTLYMGPEFDQRTFVRYAGQRFEDYARSNGLPNVNMQDLAQERRNFERLLLSNLQEAGVDVRQMQSSDQQQIRTLESTYPGLGNELARLAVSSSHRVVTENNVDYQEAQAIAAASVILNGGSQLDIVSSIMGGTSARNAERFERAQDAVERLGYSEADARQITEAAVQNVRDVRTPDNQRNR